MQSFLFNDLLSQIRSIWHASPDKPDEHPENTLRALWLCAAGQFVSIQRIEGYELPTLNAPAIIRLHDLVKQRIKGVPVAYLTHRQSFMGIEMLAGPEAMIARKETEVLAHGALGSLRKLTEERGTVRAIDLCTGSGNVALALAFYEQNLEVIGADISIEAVSLANRNAIYLGLNNRARFVQSDLLTAFDGGEFDGQFDLITCNPPYISSGRAEAMSPTIAEHEPRLAFDGGPFGVKILTRVIRYAPRYLKPGSWLGVEVGRGQGKAVRRWFERFEAFKQIDTYSDNQEDIRAILART